MDAVEAEIIDVGIAIVGRRGCMMSMGGCLAVFVLAGAGARRVVVKLGDGVAEASVPVDLEGGGAAAGVVGNEQDAAGLVGIDVAGAGAARGDGVDEGEFAAGFVESVTADGPGFRPW